MFLAEVFEEIGIELDEHGSDGAFGGDGEALFDGEAKATVGGW